VARLSRGLGKHSGPAKLEGGKGSWVEPRGRYTRRKKEVE